MPETLPVVDLAIRKTPAEAALDQPQLFEIGLERIRRLSGGLWTDHNTHDPGLTALEVLAYGITDTAFRASRPLEDLLATDDDNAGNMARQFPSARRLLTNRGLTERDYRKLLIDLPGIRNAWLRPATLTYFADHVERKLLTQDPQLPNVTPVQVRGIYDVRVDFTDAVALPQAKARVLQQARELLHANRNLCEDFAGFSEVDREEFQICGELELEPGRDVDVSAIQARIFFDVQEYLAPAVSNYSLAEMVLATKPDGTPYGVDDIFNGPRLENGFIKDDELDRGDLRKSVRLSDVVNIVMDVPGVRAVRDLLITPRGVTDVADKWVIPVEEGRQPTLVRNLSRLVYAKDGVPVVPNAGRVETEYARLSAEATAKLETPRPDDRAIPLGRPRDVARYYSIQNHFPATYGIGEEGLEPGADARREALARQLKAYLLFFDQLLADYCAQLESVGRLFSTDPDSEATYFYQVVDTVREFERLYNVDLESLPVGQTPQDAARQQALDLLRARADEAPAVHDDRRHRFLDHLISRYAERFHEYASAVQTAIGTSSRTLRRHKCRFLQSYPEAAGERGAAFNYTVTPPESLWNSPNVSGLERRLSLLLDIAAGTRRDLSTVVEDASSQVFAESAADQRFRIVNDSGAVILKAPFGLATEELARAAMLHALDAAQLPAAFRREIHPDGSGTFTVVDDAGAIVAESGAVFADAAALDLAIDDALDFVRRHYGREGLYVIENLLLRAPADELLLQICGDSNCQECGDDDPYSYRIHVIVAADGGRFRSMAFRQYAESVIRAETPAHILPKICWIAAEDQRQIERAYREWLLAGATAETPEGQSALKALKAALEKAKSVYETSRLADCDSPDGMSRFLLGQRTLGTTPDQP